MCWYEPLHTDELEPDPFVEAAVYWVTTSGHYRFEYELVERA